jgi:hypothetical protein
VYDKYLFNNEGLVIKSESYASLLTLIDDILKLRKNNLNIIKGKAL